MMMKVGEQVHLVTSIGLADYKICNYMLGGRQYSTAFAPVALSRLKNLSGAKASILVTSRARESNYKKIAAELEDAGLKPQAVDIPDGKGEDEIYEIFRIITGQVEEGESIILDVTFSLRHLPFAYLAALVYLVGLRQVRLEGIYYGASELMDEGRVPILEITSLFRLIEWYHGLTAARQEGDFRPLGRLMRGDMSRLFQAGAGDETLARISRLTGDLALSLSSVLPLEVGCKSGDVLGLLDQVSTRAGYAHTSLLALKSLVSVLEQWKLEGVPGGRTYKGSIVLSREELIRQLALARWYIERMNLPAALLVMREWLVSLLQLKAGHTRDWLGYNRRKRYESQLNALVARSALESQRGLDLCSPVEKKLASVWDTIRNQRNLCAHAGMDETEVRPSPDTVKNALENCYQLLDTDLPPGFPIKGKERFLLTPLGLSKGVLYTGLKLVCPHRLVVLTSAQVAGFIPEIIAEAGMGHLEPVVIQLDDPHLGFEEARRIAEGRDDLLGELALAGQLVINITGGTTALQYAVEYLALRVSLLGVAVKKVALTDRRPYEEQRDNPFVCGEMIVLNEE